MDTAAIEEHDVDFLASHKTWACVAISAAVLWSAAARWSRMEDGNLRRNKAKNNEYGADVSYLGESISEVGVV
jgi:hypothetical protein